MNSDDQDDAVIAEIREIRRRIFAECGNDPQRLFERQVEFSKQFKDRLVSMHDLEGRGKDDRSAA
jgi:hypothetical protein